MHRLTIVPFIVALAAAFAAPGTPALAGPRCGFHRHWVPAHYVRFHGHRHFVRGHCT
jgi:hypothetical protein